MVYLVVAVGSWSFYLPMHNLKRPYYFDKKSKEVLRFLQNKKCAGPQKQEVINGHSSTIFWQKKSKGCSPIRRPFCIKKIEFTV